MRSDFDYCIVMIVKRMGLNYRSDLATDVLTKNVSYKMTHSQTAPIACLLASTTAMTLYQVCNNLNYI